jgi:ribA/ribD-fused uncharacterized protein
MSQTSRPPEAYEPRPIPKPLPSLDIPNHFAPKLPLSSLTKVTPTLRISSLPTSDHLGSSYHPPSFTTMDYYSRSRTQNMRRTDTHIYFWGSVLSNWHQGVNFSGARALEFLVPRLETIKINLPPRSHRSSQHILRHSFNCGEQFMMACKAWLFDRDPDATVLRSILASKKPADQKAMRRKVPSFNETIWEAVSIEIVVASQIARAELDPQLAIIYRTSGGRIFVEGSPHDTIWGVGLHWNEKLIENERNWKGKNKLGICHGLARQALLEQMTKRTATEQNSMKTSGEDAINFSRSAPRWDVETQAWLDFRDVAEPSQKG